MLVAAPQIGAFQAVSRIYFTTPPPAVDSKAATVRAPLPESPSAALLGTAEGAAQRSGAVASAAREHADWVNGWRRSTWNPPKPPKQRYARCAHSRHVISVPPGCSTLAALSNCAKWQVHEPQGS